MVLYALLWLFVQYYSYTELSRFAPFPETCDE